jgi:hypothetical protein
MQTTYEVGQVLYVIMSRDKSVIPVRIIEQVLRKTLDGETVSYIVELPTQTNEQVPLEKLGSGVYSSSGEAMSAMIKNAEATIKKIIKKAEAVAASVFDVNNEPVEADIDNSDNLNLIEDVSEQDQGAVEVDLGGGVKGKVSIKGL